MRVTYVASWYHAGHLRAAAVLLLLLGSAAPACAGGRPADAAESPAPKASSEPKPRPAPRWARFDEVSAWLPVNPEPFASRGHGTSGYLLQVRVSEDVRQIYMALRPATTMPNGTVVAAFHKDAKTGRPGPVYVMERRADTWSYSAFEADGSAAEHGVLTLCERCHSESPNRGLYGLPH